MSRTGKKSVHFILLVLVFGAGLWGLSRLEYPKHLLLEQLAKKHLPELLTQLKPSFPISKGVSVYVYAPGFSEPSKQEITNLVNGFGITPAEQSPDRLLVQVYEKSKRAHLHVTYFNDQGVPKAVGKQQNLFLWESLLVPLLAIMAAMLFQKITLALGLGVVLGGLLANRFDLLPALHDVLISYVWTAMADISHLYIYAFTLLLLAMVGVMTGTGSMAALMEWFSGLAKSVRATRLSAFFMGLVVFFDDYANTMVVGSAMRPLFDKAKVSRAKLAYIVDSTAAPVAGLAIFSTWVAYEVSQFDGVFTSHGWNYSGFVVFLSALLFRFYCGFALLFVFLNAWLGRDFGPMLKSERAALQAVAATEPLAPAPSHAQMLNKTAIWVAVVPLIFVVLGLPIWLLLDGIQAGEVAAGISVGEWFRTVLGQANSSKVLMYVSLVAWLLASGLALLLKVGRVPALVKGTYQGMRSVIPALVILTLAWSIQSACGAVNMADYLGALLGSNVSALWLAPGVFLLSSAVSFATGTSFGTMALMIPIALPLAVMTGSYATLVLVAAAVLDGSIFGDHCSPISDTTIMSSIGSSCNHMEHVRTQLPYALVTMGVAVIAGYVLVGLGIPFWGSWILGAGVLYLVLRYMARPVEAVSPAIVSNSPFFRWPKPLTVVKSLLKSKTWGGS